MRMTGPVGCRGSLGRRAGGAAVAFAALLVVACGAAGSVSTIPGPTVTSAPPSTSPTAAPGVVSLGDSDDGRTVTVGRGQRVVVTLNSTYWTIADSTNSVALRQQSAPTYAPHPAGCVPGQGCGTVSASFDAVGDGRADLSASRTSCGEAMRCVGSAGSWRVTVVVTG